MQVNDIQENYGEGWISIYRSVLKHWLFPKKRELTKFEAWLTILLEVNHSDAKVQIGYNIIECKRGESLNSLGTWAKFFNWNKSKVRRFFILLQKDNMIRFESVQKSTHLTVCNYDIYQGERNASETQVKRKRNASETQVNTNNKNNNENNENNENNSLGGFEFFFNSYYEKIKKPKEQKEKAKREWEKLTQQEQIHAHFQIESYSKTKPQNEHQYLAMCKNYLSGKLFNNEFKKIPDYDIEAIKEELKKQKE